MEFWTAPFGPYQQEAFDQTCEWKTAAHFWEQGLGKSWLAINVARKAYEDGRIDALLITAPNGVHSAWINDQLYEHLPPDYPWSGMVWWPSVAHNYWPEVKANLRSFMDQEDRLLVLSTSYHAFLQPRSYSVIKQFLSERKVLWVLDESDDIGTASATWTKRILKLGPLAAMRRIGTGTPYKDGTPLAYWSQFYFLHPAILGFPTYKAFKLHFAEWYFRPLPGRPYDAMIPVKDVKTGRQKFKNLDELETKIAVRSVRMTKAEALPDLPPKVFERLWVEMSPRQAEVYERLRDQYELDLGGDQVRMIELPMIQRLRLQQVACGFYPSDGEEPERVIPGGLPRLDTAVEAIVRTPGQVIVWARFHMDIDLLVAELSLKVPTRRYDGRTNDIAKAHTLASFAAGDTKVLVANQASLSRGHTFVNSTRAFFYSNYDKLLLRVQAEDRQHRIGTRAAVLYTDITTHNTVDVSIVTALRAKMDVADYLSRRPRKEWLI